MTEHDLNAPPLFTLRLGAAGKPRPAEEVVVNLIREAGFEAFSLAETKGWFRGEADPGWAITIAHDDHERVAQLAEDGVHAEPGRAADLSQEEARALGQNFQQAAVYVVQEGQFRVVACGDGRMAPVAAFASRVKP